LNLCPDTNVAIDLIREQKPHLRQRMAEASEVGWGLHLSPIVLHELVLGATLSARPRHQMALVERFCAALLPHDWSNDDAMESARMRAELSNAGMSIGVMDNLIAGQARNRGWTVITANIREFARIEGLQIVDWSDPAGPIDLTGAMARLRRPSKD
jgi:tRNA(fMet)-specific endonuclease VapC